MGDSPTRVSGRISTYQRGGEGGATEDFLVCGVDGELKDLVQDVCRELSRERRYRCHPYQPVLVGETKSGPYCEGQSTLVLINKRTLADMKATN